MKSKQMLFAAALAAALIVLAVPAVASAAVWKHKGADLTKFVELGLSGGELFDTGSGGMSCEITATMATEGGEEAEITEFEIVQCPTGFEDFAECEMTGAEAIGLPWLVQVNSTDLTIEEMRTRRTFDAGCPVGELDKTIAETTVALNTPSAISEMEFLGETTGYMTVGSFTVEGTNKGTYGIG